METYKKYISPRPQVQAVPTQTSQLYYATNKTNLLTKTVTSKKTVDNQCYIRNITYRNTKSYQPHVSNDLARAAACSRLTLPHVGLMPYMLQNDAGTRTDPAVSVPSEKSTSPLATATFVIIELRLTIFRNKKHNTSNKLVNYSKQMQEYDNLDTYPANI